MQAIKLLHKLLYQIVIEAAVLTYGRHEEVTLLILVVTVLLNKGLALKGLVHLRPLHDLLLQHVESGLARLGLGLHATPEIKYH